MELQQLQYFKTVAETGKLTEAARKLYISAPALSTSISRLEKDLGAPLFDRTNSGIRLNRQGEIFLKYVNQALSALDSGQNEVQQSLLADSRHIRIACNNTTQWADLVAAFGAAYPQISVSVENWQMQGGYDFLLTTEDEVPAEASNALLGMDLYYDRIMAVVHPAHPIADRESVSPAELAEEQLFLPMPEYPWYNRLVELFAESGQTLPQGNAFSYIMTQRMAAEGSGVAFSTEQMQKTLPFPVRFVPITGKGPTWLCRIYWHKEMAFTPEQQSFLNFTKEYYKILS